MDGQSAAKTNHRLLRVAGQRLLRRGPGGVTTKADLAGLAERAGLAEKADLGGASLMNTLQASGGTNDKVLDELHCRYSHLVHNVLRRQNIRQAAERDDVAQLVWCKVWRISRKGTQEKGAWNPRRREAAADPFAALVTTIAHTQTIDYYRKRTRARRRHAAYLDDRRVFGGEVADLAVTGHKKRRDFLNCLNPSLPSAGGAISRRGLAAAVQRLPQALAAIPARERTVLMLTAEGFTVREIGARAQCSGGEASKRLSRARQAARLQLQAAS